MHQYTLLYSPNDLAKIIGISANGVRAALRDGRMTSWGLTQGGVHIFSESDVQEIIAERKRTEYLRALLGRHGEPVQLLIGG